MPCVCVCVCVCVRARAPARGGGGWEIGRWGHVQNSQWAFTLRQVFPSFRYKDGSLICQAEEPGKYRIESKYGVHTLEINR